MNKCLWILGSLICLWGLPSQAQEIFAARVLDIPQEPVFAWQSPGPEFAAEVGTVIREGGYLRTTKPGKAQVMLSNGLAFRLGGNAVLRVSENIDVEQGRIIAWGEEPSVEPRKIETPVATAAIVGTTVFIDVEPQQVTFFCWGGEIIVSLPDGSEQVKLLAGEEITVQQGATSLPKPQKISRADVKARFATTEDLFSDFQLPMRSSLEIKRSFDL